MKTDHLSYLICPKCKNELSFCKIVNPDNRDIKDGELICKSCENKYPIVNYIPRFVDTKNYTDSFGIEWNKHAVTQYDDYTNNSISEKRFFEETKWPRLLKGETILEVGCGSGRFTAHAASTGATVISLDMSNSVEANYASNGKYDNVFIIQADIYKMPLRENFFDKLFCFGVLQHTPNVEKSFKLLPSYLKPNGRLAIDVYRKYPIRGLWNTKYWVRPITKKIQPQKLYNLILSYVNFMWPIAKLINKIPVLGNKIVWALLIADYSKIYDLPDNILKEWAILDSFDRLSPLYDQPQRLATVERWFYESNLKEIEVIYGYNGIEGRAKK